MAKQPFKTFRGLKTEIRNEVWPGVSPGTSNEAENLVQAHDAHFVEAISEIQRECPGLRHLQTNVVRFEKTFFKDGMTVVPLPPGIVTRIFTVDENWFQPVYYVERDWPEPQARGFANHGKLGLLVDVEKTLPLGFMHADAALDRRSGRARGGIWAKDPQTRNICLSPWLQSQEMLVIEWNGVKNASEWGNEDPVSDAPDFKKVMKLYVQWAHERDFGDRNQATALRNANFSGTLDIALADLILWDRELLRVHSEQGEVISRQQLHGFAANFGPFPDDPTADWPARAQPTPPLSRAPGAPLQPGSDDLPQSEE